MKYQTSKRHMLRTLQVKNGTVKNKMWHCKLTSWFDAYVFHGCLNCFQTYKRDSIWQKGNFKTANCNWRMQMHRILTWVWTLFFFSWCFALCRLFYFNIPSVLVSPLVMEVADLQAQLKKAQKQAARAAGKNISGLSCCFFLKLSSSRHIVKKNLLSWITHLWSFLSDLEKQLKAQQTENKKLESSTKGRYYAC